MNLKIKHIILWPKDQTKEKRIVIFDTEKINVITGESHKGKSSLVHIIDYCLGSGRCTIPIGIIRDKTEWFGIHVVADKTEILLARRGPGQQIYNDEMYYDESVNVDLEVLPRTNTNRKNVINRLNQIAGFSTERFDKDNLNDRFKSAASFRDTSAFQFQPQHIVANPFTLFYKADTLDHQQKLRTIFPLVLGTVTNEVLALEREIKELENLLKNKKQILATKKQAINAWLSNLKGLFNMSITKGLLKDIPEPTNNWDVEKYLFYLHKVIEDFKTNPIPLIQEGSAEKSIHSLNTLLKEERELSSEISSRRIKLEKIDRLNNASKNYQTTITIQQKRLEPISWFKSKLHSEKCPFCDSENQTAKNQIESLEKVVVKLENISQAISTSEVNLDKEISEIKSGIRELENKLNSAREVIRDVYKQSQEANRIRQSIEDIYRFIGRLEQALENVQSTEIDSSIDRDIKSLESRLAILQKEYNEKREKNKLENVLRKLSGLITNYVELLDIDKPNDLVKLDIQNLTLKVVSSESNRENYLWEIGSGANWMGYHLSALLALHEHFLSMKNNFIPSFILIDQPSQVYFPDQFPSVEERISTYEQYEESNASQDLKQVRKVFKTLNASLDRTKGNLQIIVVEHAPKLTWQGIPNIHLVEEWRGGNALIPNEW